MRLVIETSDDERDAIRKLCSSLDTTYSALFRALFRRALKGKIEDLRAMLAEPRSVLSVSLPAPLPAPAPPKARKDMTTEEIAKKLGWDIMPKKKGKR